VSDGRVAAVVLSWNGRDDTLACLASLEAVTYPELEVIVVDNGSSDGVAEAVAAAFPAVEVIVSEHNLGFAGGSNRGIARALERDARYVLLLNNDVEVDPGFLGALVDEARRRPDAAALSSKVLFRHPADLIWFAGASFDPRRGYNGRLRGYRERDDGRFDEVVETDRAAGAAMLIPRTMFDEVGLLDERLFVYAEDAEWSLRARGLGYRIYVVPSSRVWHKVSAASGGESSPTTLYYGTRNVLEVCEHYAPLGRIGSARRRCELVIAGVIQALRSRRRREGIAAVMQGYRDQRAGRLGQRSSR
jgi:hypothetical protein